MTWHDFGGTKTTTLSQDEMDAEAERILQRIGEDGMPYNITANARQFVERKQGSLARRRLSVTLKELLWLRSINERD